MTALPVAELERWTGLTRTTPLVEDRVAGPPALRTATSGTARPRLRPGRREVYHGSEVSRITSDWVAGLLAPDDEIRGSIRRMRARGRELRRNNAYAKGYLNLLGVNVIGPRGVRLQARVLNNDGKPAKLINDKIEFGFNDWGRRVTLDGKLSLTRLCMQSLRTVAADGEMFIRKWRGTKKNRYGFALEAIDADQVDDEYNVTRGKGQNEIRMGVEIDADSTPVAYHVWNRALSVRGFTGDRTRERIPADQMIHLYDPERPNQTRGITWFAPVMYGLRLVHEYSLSELVASRIGSSKMGFFQRKAATELGDLEAEVPEGEDDGTGRRHIDMEANPGTFEFVPDGYELANWTPDHPSTAFSDFMKSELRQVATGMGIAYNELANDLENVNFSSMRSGILTARETWESMQQWWINVFMHDVYMEWLNWSLLNGSLLLDSRDPAKFEMVRWIPRGWPWVDPEADVNAEVTAIKWGMGSRRRALASKGEDFEEVLEELAEEQALAKELGIEIVEKPAPVKAFGEDQGDAKDKKKDDAKDDAKTKDKGRGDLNGHTSRLVGVL